MSASTPIVGNIWRLTSTFSQNGTAEDPTAPPVFEVTNPAGIVTTYTYGTDSVVTRTGVGVYQCLLIPNVDGMWLYKVSAGPGNGQAAMEGKFFVTKAFAT